MRPINRFRHEQFEDICLNLSFELEPAYKNQHGDIVCIGELPEPRAGEPVFTQSLDSTGRVIATSSNTGGPIIFDGPYAVVDGQFYVVEGDREHRAFEAPDFTHILPAVDLQDSQGLIFTQTTVFSDKIETSTAAETLINRIF